MHAPTVRMEGHRPRPDTNGKGMPLLIMHIVLKVDRCLLSSVYHHLLWQELNTKQQLAFAILNAEKKSIVRSPGAQANNNGELSNLSKEELGGGAFDVCRLLENNSSI